jgi:hypothetical protein
MIKLITLIIITQFQILCFGQNETNKLKLTDFKFNSIFGTQKTDSSTIFCLLGQGYFRTPRSNNSDSIMNNWYTNHENAQIIPVSSMVFKNADNPDSKMIYCWMVDGNDTLNVFLIKQGCFPGGTMQRPKTWNEMEKKEKDFYKDTDKPNVKVYISNNNYKTFIEKIKTAEKFAENNKLGIWK